MEAFEVAPFSSFMQHVLHARTGGQVDGYSLSRYVHIYRVSVEHWHLSTGNSGNGLLFLNTVY